MCLGAQVSCGRSVLLPREDMFRLSLDSQTRKEDNVVRRETVLSIDCANVRVDLLPADCCR